MRWYWIYNAIDFVKLEQFFVERVNQFYKVNPSVISAVLSTGEREILAIDAKIEAVNNISKAENFSDVFSTFKRVANITKDFDVSNDLYIDTDLLSEDAEKALYSAFTAQQKEFYDSYEAELDALFALRPELDSFFEKVMVNAEDEAVKINRKSLVGSIYKALLNIADIKEISVWCSHNWGRNMWL